MALIADKHLWPVRFQAPRGHLLDNTVHSGCPKFNVVSSSVTVLLPPLVVLGETDNLGPRKLRDRERCPGNRKGPFHSRVD